MKKYLKGLVLGLFISLILPGIVSAHTIHFETLGDKQFPDITVADDGSIDLTKYVPELEGYMFDQWTTNSDYSYGGGYESWPGDYYYHVSKDMTFYAYFYDRVYTYAYNKTTGKTDKFAGTVLDEDEYECFEGYCTVLEPYNEEWNTLNLEAKANPGFKFVEWRVGYSMPAKTHIRDNYQGLSYNETTSAGTSSKYTDVGGKGFITVYAVFEEDPNSNVKLVTEAHATMEEPIVGGTIKPREEIVVTSTEPSKYSVETGDCWAYENSSNCLLSGKFEEGQSYKLNVTLKPAEGYRINENTKLYVNDKLVQFDTSYEPTGITSMYGNVIYSFKKIEEPQTVTTKPSVPKIKVTDGQGNALVVNWANDENVTRYEVYRSTDKKKWTKFNSNDASSYESRSLTYGKTYYYKVKACNSAGCSGFSNIMGKKVVPDKVTGVKVSGSTNNLKVTWDKVSTTGYEVYMNGKKITTIKKNGTISFNKKKLKANTTYKFKVRAYKTVSGKKVYGPWSSTITSKTAPSKPSLTMTLKDYASLVIKSGTSKGATRYILQGSVDGKTYGESEEIDESINEIEDELEIGQTYYLRIKACNSYNNCSGWKTVSKKVTTVAPSYSLKTTSKKVTITLKPVTGADGYEIHRATKKNGKYTKVKELTSESELVYNNGTKKGTTYYYKVRSYKIVDGNRVYSPFSSIKSIKSK